MSAEELSAEAPGTEAQTASEKPEKADKKAQKELKKTAAELEETKRALAEAEAKLAEADDKYKRMYAEYENYRRRSAAEREGVYGEAYGDALAAILPVMDNLERAAAYQDSAQVTEGLAMILRSFKETLEKLGVSEFGCAGDAFDPAKHNAVMHVEDENFGEGEIAEVFQKGYARGERVIRYAMVKVAN